MRGRRPQGEDGRPVYASGQGQSRRDGSVLVDRLQVARASRSRQRQGDEGPATGDDDGPEGDALRLEAHGLRRLQDPGRRLTDQVALTATIYNVDIDLADADRQVYETLALRVARHPS